MRTGATQDLPAWLERVRRRFDGWRQTRDGSSRIPEAFWALAVKAVSRYGLNPTARVLRLDYYSLKRRVEAATSCGRPDRREGATFVELSAPVLGGSAECCLELEHPGGARMRVHLKGASAPDLVALSRSFWGVET